MVRIHMLEIDCRHACFIFPRVFTSCCREIASDRLFSYFPFFLFVLFSRRKPLVRCHTAIDYLLAAGRNKLEDNSRMVSETNQRDTSEASIRCFVISIESLNVRNKTRFDTNTYRIFSCALRTSILSFNDITEVVSIFNYVLR